MIYLTDSPASSLLNIHTNNQIKQRAADRSQRPEVSLTESGSLWERGKSVSYRNTGGPYGVHVHADLSRGGLSSAVAVSCEKQQEVSFAPGTHGASTHRKSATNRQTCTF